MTASLKAAAEAATPGQWGVEDPMDHCLTIVSNPEAPVYDWKWVAICDWPDEDDQMLTSREVKANAAYIAAANPQAILALIAERESAVEALRGLVDGWAKVEPHVNALTIASHARTGQKWGGPSDFADALSAARTFLATTAASPSHGREEG